MCVTCKLNLFPGKYLKLLAEIVFTIKGPRRKRQKKTVGSSLDVFFSSYAPCVRIATTVVVWDKCWPLSKYLWIYSIVVPPPPLLVSEVLLFGPEPDSDIGAVI